ncbi:MULTISPECIES: AAA family ATPase [unclassified Paraflavitalea]|uniref:AAA family ATPase n=1 Tax=unclassified Paraflavitalea TaxID=2798305 RepID=UPI003D33E73A
MEATQPKKIVIIGPESTGKSTLCDQLANHFNTIWVKEFAREYLLKNGMNYSFDDLLTIAKGQLRGEDEAVEQVRSNVSKNQDLLIVDTDMYVMKVWAEFVFNNCHSFILDNIVSRKYDLYLLCNIDLPWVKDELREYPDLETRAKLFNIYKDILINQDTPWTLISGTGEERLQAAIEAIDSLK